MFIHSRGVALTRNMNGETRWKKTCV